MRRAVSCLEAAIRISWNVRHARRHRFSPDHLLLDTAEEILHGAIEYASEHVSREMRISLGLKLITDQDTLFLRLDLPGPFIEFEILIADVYKRDGFVRPNFPLAAEVIATERRQLGPMQPAEKRVLAVFVGTALLWVVRPLLSKMFPLAVLKAVDDTSIALLGAVLLFVLPANPINPKSNLRRETLLDWSTAAKLPWHILLLFGGGLSIAAALERSGFAQFIGAQFVGLGISPFLLVLLITTAIILFGEIASNTATAATFLPILASVAKGVDLNPYLLLIPATFAASLSFMVPVGTPPNALAYGTGYVSMREMLKVGLWLDLMSILIVTSVIFLLI